MTTFNLLALNVGSTTLKGATYTLKRGGAGEPPRLLQLASAEAQNTAEPHEDLAFLLDALKAPNPDVVVHRIVHGGDLRGGHALDDILLSRLEALAPWAPLHQPPALRITRAASRRWPQVRHGAAFDTSFHAYLPRWSQRLPIPPEWDARGIRRYGFHGLAFASALREVAEYESGVMRRRTILAHLGGGCSVCAVKDGRSVDTTMALTPLGGLPGPSRSGDLDPGVVLYLLRQGDLAVGIVEDRLMRASGLAGIAGHADMRKLLVDLSDEAQLAIEIFTLRVAQAIAGMATSIGGIDHLVFSGGIGHRAPVIRARIVERLVWMGLALDADRNLAGAGRIDAGDGPAIWSAAINEERELAESVLDWL